MDTSNRARPRRERVTPVLALNFRELALLPTGTRSRQPRHGAVPPRRQSGCARGEGAPGEWPESTYFIFRPEGYLKGTGVETPRNTRRRRFGRPIPVRSPSAAGLIP